MWLTQIISWFVIVINAQLSPVSHFYLSLQSILFTPQDTVPPSSLFTCFPHCIKSLTGFRCSPSPPTLAALTTGTNTFSHKKIWIYLLIQQQVRWSLMDLNTVFSHQGGASGRCSSWDLWHCFCPRTPELQLFAISHPDGCRAQKHHPELDNRKLGSYLWLSLCSAGPPKRGAIGTRGVHAQLKCHVLSQKAFQKWKPCVCGMCPPCMDFVHFYLSMGRIVGINCFSKKQ